MTYRKPPFLLRKWQQLQMRYYAYRNPEKLVRIRYRQRFGTDPDLENPRTFNEKVLWMMLHADTTRWPTSTASASMSSNAGWDGCSTNYTVYGNPQRR